jgi:hypothetical protein
MNNENGLPAEVQKFMDKYLHTEQERQLFIKDYQQLQSAQARADFLRSTAAVPTEAEIQDAEAAHTALRQSENN